MPFNLMINLTEEFCNKDEYKLVKKEIKIIIAKFINNLIDLLIKTGDPVTLPHRLGNFRLFKYNTTMPNKESGDKKKLINYNLTKKYKSEGHDVNIKMNNLSTKKYWWTFKWYKNAKSTNIRCKDFYKCTLVRSVRRSTGQTHPRHLTITDYFRDIGWQSYIELPKTKYFLDLL